MRCNKDDYCPQSDRNFAYRFRQETCPPCPGKQILMPSTQFSSLVSTMHFVFWCQGSTLLVKKSKQKNQSTKGIICQFCLIVQQRNYLIKIVQFKFCFI